MDLAEKNGGFAVEPGYNPCSYVDFSDKDQNSKKLVKCYKEISAAAVVDQENSNNSAPDSMCVQISLPAQPPRIDVSKDRSPESVASLMKKLCITRSRLGAGTSKD